MKVIDVINLKSVLHLLTKKADALGIRCRILFRLL